MIAATIAALGTALSSGWISKATTADIFEAYIFALVIVAARKEGAAVQYEDVYGSPERNLLFRTSPGYLHSKAQAFTHGVLTFAGHPELEVHLGIRIAGKSQVLHEADVAVLTRAEATLCRRTHVPPRASAVKIAVECKHYTSVLPLGMARGFIGLTSDLYTKGRYFVSNTTSSSVEKLLVHRNLDWDKNIVPAAKKEIERLVNQFQTEFRNYCAS